VGESGDAEQLLCRGKFTPSIRRARESGADGKFSKNAYENFSKQDDQSRTEKFIERFRAFLKASKSNFKYNPEIKALDRLR